MTALSDKIAGARPEDTRELLIELWKQTSSFSGDCLSDEYLEWSRKKDAFWRMLDAEAYESAVLMMVPEGWSLSFGEKRGLPEHVRWHGWLAGSVE